MDQPQLFAYLDHNVLDRMTKGDPDAVIDLLKRSSLTPVFSDENLAEIRRSKGYEKNFLDILERIEARYLVPILDSRFKYTGNAEIRIVNPRETYHEHVNNVDVPSEFGFGLSGTLLKFYGGHEGRSFAESIELRELFTSLRQDLAGLPEAGGDFLYQLDFVIAGISENMDLESDSIASQLDAQPGPVVKRLEKKFGIGPKILKNVQGPNVLRKIWTLVKERLPDVEVDMEVFFGIKPFPFEVNADRTRTTMEKINGIYHQLNFLGYYRDSKMVKQRRFTASFSDMTHAGIASFCHVLLSCDEDLNMKAEAAYEYLGVGTKVLQLPENNSQQHQIE